MTEEKNEMDFLGEGSYIFTPSEIRAMVQYLNKDYSDKTGLFSRKVRKKLMEIKAWNHPGMKRIVNNLLKPKKRQRKK